MKLGEKIFLLRKEKNMTMQKLADKSNLTKGYISMLEKGKNPQTGREIIPSLETVNNIALAFDLDLETLLRETDSSISLHSTHKSSTLDRITSIASKLEEARQVKMLDFAVEQLGEQNKVASISEVNEELYPIDIFSRTAAASGISFGYNYEANVDKEVLYSNRKVTVNYDFATKVNGDSMEPQYFDGDVILIKKGYDSINGDIYVVDYDGKSYLKKVYLKDNQFRLVSLNDKYEDILIDLPVDADLYFNIVGKVVDSFTPINA